MTATKKKRMKYAYIYMKRRERYTKEEADGVYAYVCKGRER
mgnify:CR=1 FL=1